MSHERYRTLIERTPEQTDAILQHYPESKWRVCPVAASTDEELREAAVRMGADPDDPLLRACGCMGCVAAMNSFEWGRGPTPAEFWAWQAWKEGHRASC